MVVDYCKHSQALCPRADVVSLREQINMASDILYAASDLANTFFSILRKRRKDRVFTYLKMTTEYITGLLQGCVNTSAPCQNIG